MIYGRHHYYIYNTSRVSKGDTWIGKNVLLEVKPGLLYKENDNCSECCT